MAALATKYAVRRPTISDLLVRSGVVRRQPRTLDMAGTQAAVKLYGDGWSLLQIGDRLGFDAETIRTHLHRLGVVMRNPNGPHI